METKRSFRIFVIFDFGFQTAWQLTEVHGSVFSYMTTFAWSRDTFKFWYSSILIIDYITLHCTLERHFVDLMTSWKLENVQHFMTLNSVAVLRRHNDVNYTISSVDTCHVFDVNYTNSSGANQPRNDIVRFAYNLRCCGWLSNLTCCIVHRRIRTYYLKYKSEAVYCNQIKSLNLSKYHLNWNTVMSIGLHCT